MTLLSETTEGMHNLFRLSTGAWRDGFFKHPRMDRELLAAARPGHHRHHRLPRPARSRSTCATASTTRPARPPADFQDILGRDNYFLELMDHGLDIENRVRDGLLQLAKDLADPAARHQRLPLRHAGGRQVAGAPALHQLRQHDGHPRRRRPGQRFAFNGDGYYIKSAAEMRELWADKYGLPEACDNTLLIAERCDVSLHRGQRHLHAALPVPAGRERGLLAGQGGREGPRSSATPTASPTRSASRPTSRSA